jgi:hypothetical protein
MQYGVREQDEFRRCDPSDRQRLDRPRQGTRPEFTVNNSQSNNLVCYPTVNGHLGHPTYSF